jgi:GNAT superfamily N-acetyltransferase
MRPYAGGIRRAVPQDYPALARLWHEAWHDGHALAVPADLLRHRGPDFFTAEMQRIGPACHVWEGLYGAEGFVTTTGRWIDRLFVSQPARGGGIAGRLMAHAEDLLRANGHAEGWTDALVGNDRALRFYQRQGWQQDRIEEIDVPTPDGPIPLRTRILRKGLTDE